MTTDSWLALIILCVTVTFLVIGNVPPLIVLGGALAAMVFADVAEPEVALSGLSSPAPVTIAALYVVAGAATATGLFVGVVDRLLSRNRSTGLLPAVVAALSAFIPNTPLIAMFAPQVVRWAERTRADASRFLLPMSFASILGGVVTLIGTSTNLVVSDLLEASGQQPLGIFEITVVGLPVAVVGVTVLSTLCLRLLPSRTVNESITRRAREFQIALRIDPDGPLVGQSVEEARLRDLDGAYLTFVERGHHGRLVAVPATPETELQGNDVCCFVGDVDRVFDLNEIDGLTTASGIDDALVESSGTMVYEAVVAPASSLIGNSLRSTEFRGSYGGAVMAIHRTSEELEGQLGRIRLRAGDVLLVLADEDFDRRWRGHNDFSLVAALDRPPLPRRGRARFVLVVIVALVAAAASGVVSLLEASVAGAIAVVAVGALSVGEATRSVNVNVVFTMAVAIGLGSSVATSGLTAESAGLIEQFDGLGAHGLVLATMIATIALSELMTNTAAAAIMVPIALAVAADAGVEPRMLAIGVLFAASCSFLSPIGYQTNLMVAGIGGYRFTDFTRAGAPLTVSTVVVVVALGPVFFG